MLNKPFFSNYDLYDNPTGPGAGYLDLLKHKSIKDFLKNKRKKAARSIEIRKILLKTAIDFAIDDQIKSSPILGENDSYSNSVYIGGIYDYANPFYDFEDKSIDKLDFGRDYTDNKESDNVDIDQIQVEEAPYGLPDGLFDREDLADYGGVNPYFGTTDLGNLTFDGVLF